MLRNVLAVAAGYAVWTVIFLGGSAGIRSGMPQVHDADGFTNSAAALSLYLLISFLASLAAGTATGRVASSPTGKKVLILGLLLLATGIPVQLSAWDRIPLWYNLVFLAALVPVTVAGGRFFARPAPA